VNPGQRAFILARFRLYFAAVTLLVILGAPAQAAPTREPSLSVPAQIVLADQFDAEQRLDFPATNITVFVVADRRGSDQVDGWIGLLHGSAMSMRVCGIADLRGCPGFLRSRIRRKFKETRHYPVMLDWTGSVARQFDPRPDRANVYVVGTRGNVLARFDGAATGEVTNRFAAAVGTAIAETRNAQ
jgi:hypothetical protein